MATGIARPDYRGISWRPAGQCAIHAAEDVRRLAAKLGQNTNSNNCDKDQYECIFGQTLPAGFPRPRQRVENLAECAGGFPRAAHDPRPQQAALSLFWLASSAHWTAILITLLPLQAQAIGGEEFKGRTLANIIAIGSAYNLPLTHPVSHFVAPSARRGFPGASGA
jgi:hypothetical protein